MTDTMHPSLLHLYHRNPRKGDVAAIAASLRVNGQYKPLVVNTGTHTGRPHEVLAGNHTLMAIRDLAEKHTDDERWHHVLVHHVDVDDDAAARIVAADNRTSQLGEFDDRLLAELLADLPDLEGTGYNEQDLDDLLGSVPDFDVDDDDTSLDELDPKPCPNCGYDTANDPDGLKKKQKADA